jgi:hypothetical protein
MKDGIKVALPVYRRILETYDPAYVFKGVSHHFLYMLDSGRSVENEVAQ